MANGAGQRRGLSASVIGLVLVFLSIGAPSASGHRNHGFGGLWPHSSRQFVYLPYAAGGQGITPHYNDVINRSMRAWYDTHTWIWPYPVDSKNVVYFNVGAVDSTWWGLTTDYQGNAECLTYGCQYSFSLVILNRSTLDPEKARIQQKVIVHEFGHVIGLSHPCASGRCPRRVRTIMNQGLLPYDTPQNHDINDVNRMYP